MLVTGVSSMVPLRCIHVGLRLHLHGTFHSGSAVHTRETLVHARWTLVHTHGVVAFVWQIHVDVFLATWVAFQAYRSCTFWLFFLRTGSTCPVKGQVYNQCKGCPVTCGNHGQPIPCPAICAPGCACPHGQVINEKSNTCIFPEECPGRHHSIHLLAIHTVMTYNRHPSTLCKFILM